MDAAFESCRADYVVAHDVCETLATLQPQTDAEKSCVLDMLITVSHSPGVSAEDRDVLHRLADLFHVSWTRSWESLSRGSGPSERKTYVLRCYVPPRCPMIWDGMLAQADVNARMCGVAATVVRSVQGSLPRGGFLDRTRGWIDVAQACFSVTAQKLRREELPVQEGEMV